MHIKSFVFNPFMENTYLVSDESKNTMIIDPGCYTKEEEQELATYIESNGLKPVLLLNTHCHIDHVLGNSFVQKKYGLELQAHPKEVAQLASVKIYAPNYGFHQYQDSEISKYLEEGDEVNLGDYRFKVIFVPGHAPGHIALHCEKENVCFSGDVLFRQSIGRTDLPGGDFDTLIESIQTKLFPLADDLKIYSGHGESTTIAYEKNTNPFLR